MIADTISQKIADAMKAHDDVRLSTLRLLSSAFNYEKIAKQHDLSEEEEIAVVRREAKMRKDAIDAYQKAQAIDRVEKEKKELAILQEFLPPEMSDEELSQLVNESISDVGVKNIAEMGKVIGIIMAKTKGAVDGNKVSELVRSKLSRD